MQYRTDGRPIVWVVILLLSMTEKVVSQSPDRYFFRHLTREDGLIHNNVLDLCQDQKGYIWIATENGLQRYDGYRFQHFRDVLNDPAASYSGAVAISEDPLHNIFWINKGNITEKVDPVSGRIRYYQPKELLNEPGFRASVYDNKGGGSWLAGPGALFFDDTVNIVFRSQRSRNHSSGNFAIDPVSGDSWMGVSVHGLTLFDVKTKKMYTAAGEPQHHPLLAALWKAYGGQQFKAREVMFDSQHNLWIGTWSDFFLKYDARTRQVKRYPLSAFSTVSCFYEDDHQALWVCTDQAGLLRYDAGADRFNSVLMDENDRVDSLTDRDMHCIVQDREENIWIGTDRGLVVFNPYRQYFRYIHHDKSNAASLPKEEVDCSIQTRTGQILVGTWGGGITVYDSLWHFLKNLRFPGPSEYNFIWDLAEQDDGTIWAGCQHGYLHLYDPVTGKVRSIQPPETEHFTIRCMAKDRDGNIWMGLHNGKIIKWDRLAQRFYGFGDSVARSVRHLSPVVSIFFDSKGRCWAGTENGLKRFDPVTRSYVAEYLPDKNKPGAITSYAPKGMTEWDDSTLLIGTLYGGLNFFNPTSGQFRRAFLGDSLTYNNVYAVKRDAAGYCWFTSDDGICRFKPGNGEISRFNINPGIMHSSFNALDFDLLRNGDWVTSTVNGVVVFHPGILAGKDTSRVEISGFKIFDSSISTEVLADRREVLRLDHPRNFITIEFARLRFGGLHPCNYYYRLKGVNEAWINARTKAFATYTNLSPGSYVFEVKADDGDESDMSAVTALAFVIKPPFWRTWWFIGLVAAAIVYLLYRLIRWRLEVLSMNEKLSLARLEALRSQMNPHFIFNCLSSIDNLIQTGDKGKATTYLAKFARLIRSILETSKANAIPCWKDMETLALYLEMESLRCDKRFSYTLDISDELAHGDYQVPPLVIQPFVENAIHHGLMAKREKDKSLRIFVSVSREHIHYVVEDNGIGREKAMEYRLLNKPSHQSMGLQISTDRINLYNQEEGTGVIITDLYDEEGQAAGTKVEVKIKHQP